MDTDLFRKALKEAVRERGEAVKRIRSAETQITRLDQTITGLRALIGVSADVDISTVVAPTGEVTATPDTGDGLTDTVRRVLKASKHPMTPPQVRVEVLSLGYKFKNPLNAAVSVNVVLNRLVKQREARVAIGEGKKPIGYEWDDLPF